MDGGNVEPQFTDENIQNIVERASAQPVDSNRAADNVDSGIAGSYWETNSDVAASSEGHRKAGSCTDTADKLIACAEHTTFLSASLDRGGESGLAFKETGGSEEEKEKFTTETGMVSCTGCLFIT